MSQELPKLPVRRKDPAWLAEVAELRAAAIQARAAGRLRQDAAPYAYKKAPAGKGGWRCGSGG